MRPETNPSRAGGKPGQVCARRGGGSHEDLHHHGQGVLSGPGLLTGEALVEHRRPGRRGRPGGRAPARPALAPAPCRPACPPPCRAGSSAGRDPAGARCRDRAGRRPPGPAAAQEEVLGFDVAVHHAPAVQDRQRARPDHACRGPAPRSGLSGPRSRRCEQASRQRQPLQGQPHATVLELPVRRDTPRSPGRLHARQDLGLAFEPDRRRPASGTRCILSATGRSSAASRSKAAYTTAHAAGPERVARAGIVRSRNGRVGRAHEPARTGGVVRGSGVLRRGALSTTLRRASRTRMLTRQPRRPRAARRAPGLTEEQVVGDGPFDLLPDHPVQRPRAVLRVEAELRRSAPSPPAWSRRAARRAPGAGRRADRGTCRRSRP
jgi:hypothetical protein